MKLKTCLKSFFTLIIGILVALLLFGGGEILFRVFLYKPNATKTIKVPPISVPDPLMGWKLKPNVKGQGEIIRGNHKISFCYTTDAKGRRVTPQNLDVQKTKVCLFFPCSLTFGEGVNDNETFPFFFAQLNPSCKVYNYGIPGGSPQYMYLMVHFPGFFEDLENLPALLIYLFIPHQINRLIGTFNLIGTWGKNFPCIELENESLIYRGTFREVYPIRYWFSKTLHSSKLIGNSLNAFNIDYPKSFSKKDYELLIKILLETTKKLRTYFPEVKMIFVFNPGSSSECPGLKTMLEVYKEDIVCIDYMNTPERIETISKMSEEGKYLLLDGLHPTAEAHKTMAQFVSEDLKNLGILK